MAHAALNNLTWRLATSPYPKVRNPRKAIELAEEVVELSPQKGIFWNTLGVARYRSGDWQGAVDALNRSMQLRQGGDGFDWLFLAMTHWQLGHQEQARKYYQQAVNWMEQDKERLQDAELQRFRAEAEKLLKTDEHRLSKK
jgi:uncharacterized protein HemY